MLFAISSYLLLQVFFSRPSSGFLRSTSTLNSRLGELQERTSCACEVVGKRNLLINRERKRLAKSIDFHCQPFDL